MEIFQNNNGENVRRYWVLLTIWLLIIPLSQFAQVAINWIEFSVLKKQYGEVAYNRAKALEKLLIRLEKADTATKLEEVNRFFNRFNYESDESLWKQKDYWQTPTEFIGMNAGDCEDYVISKYFALRALGIPDEKLFLTYAKAVRKKWQYCSYGFELF